MIDTHGAILRTKMGSVEHVQPRIKGVDMVCDDMNDEKSLESESTQR